MWVAKSVEEMHHSVEDTQAGNNKDFVFVAEATCDNLATAGRSQTSLDTGVRGLAREGLPSTCVPFVFAAVKLPSSCQALAFR